MKIDFKNPVVITVSIITVSIIAVLAIFYFGGTALLNAGQKNALEQELEAINKQLENTSASRSGGTHIQLLAKRTAIQELLQKI